MRTNILPSELKVGDTVAIVGSSYSPQRGYIVTKKDKMKAVLTRADGYARYFSVKRNTEVAGPGKTYVERYSFIVSEVEAERMDAVKRQGQNFSNACRNLEAAASSKNLASIRIAMAELEAVEAEGEALKQRLATN